MNPILQDALIFMAFGVSMAARDIVYTIETKADANNRVGVAAIADVLGDGLTSLSNIFTIAIVAAGLSHSGEAVQVLGNMAGGLAGVIAGNHLSVQLDRRIAAYKRRPSDASVARAATTISRAIEKAGARRHAGTRSAGAVYHGPISGNPHYDETP